MKTVILIFAMVIISETSGFAQDNNITTRKVEEAKGLEVGIKAPQFITIDADSNTFNLQEALKNGPIVIVFYRGFWCPVCNKHLSQLQDSLEMIQRDGVQLIAISPERPEYLHKMEEKSGASFTLLFDKDYKISEAYDVIYKPTSMQLFTYNALLGGKLKRTHSDDSQQLPIPATFIIDTNGIIVWRQFDPNYHNRSSAKEIIRQLELLLKN